VNLSFVFCDELAGSLIWAVTQIHPAVILLSDHKS
jgi:hypothetical protein